MATPKVTITAPGEVRRILAEELAADFQAECGAFPPEVIAAARAEMVAADAEARRLRQPIA